jgi:hypothetical protein
MSREAVSYVTRHLMKVPGRMSTRDKGLWLQCLPFVYRVADLSDQYGRGCRETQLTMSTEIGLSRKKVNELMGHAVRFGMIIKTPKSQTCEIAGMAGHDLDECSHPYCVKESATRLRQAQPAVRRRRRPVGLPAAVLDAADGADRRTARIAEADRLRARENDQHRAASRARRPVTRQETDTAEPVDDSIEIAG